MKLSVGMKLITSFASIIVLMVVIVVFSFTSLQKIEHEVNQIIEDAIPLGNAASSILSDLINQETGMRGYLVTGDEAFLEPYYAGQESIVHTLNNIDQYLDGHPIMAGLIAEAKPQITAVQSYLEEQIALVRNGQIEIARAHINDGKAQMDAFRTTNEHIVADVAKLTNDAWERANRAQTNMITVLIIVSVIAIIGTIIITLLLIRSISNPVRQVTERIKLLADGDLTQDRIQVRNRDEIGQMVDSMNLMSEKLQHVIGGVVVSSQSVSAAAEQISASTEEIAGVSTSQAGSAQTLSELFKELTTVITAVANNADQAARFSNDSKQVAESGGAAVKDSIDAMEQLDRQMKRLTDDSSKIGEIIEVIDDIADQTNLLALNAAIEAARAGDQGRGFAVVAEEVRKLAERSGEATKQITSIIKGMQDNTKLSAESVVHAVKLSQQTGDALQNIVEKVNQAAGQVTDIAAASEEQAAQADEVQRAVESIAASSEEASASVEETASSAQSLANLAQDLNRMVEAFRLR